MDQSSLFTADLDEFTEYTEHQPGKFRSILMPRVRSLSRWVLTVHIHDIHYKKKYMTEKGGRLGATPDKTMERIYPNIKLHTYEY